MSTSPTTHESVIARIVELAAEKELSVNRLADFSGLSRGYVSTVLRGKKSPTLRTLIKLADALEVSVSSFFKAP